MRYVKTASMSRSKWQGSVATKCRAHWKARLHQEGMLPCYRCGKPVTPEMRWDVEHTVRRVDGGNDGDLSTQWVSHAACNRADGGRVGAARTNARKAERKPVVLNRWPF